MLEREVRTTQSNCVEFRFRSTTSIRSSPKLFTCLEQGRAAQTSLLRHTKIQYTGLSIAGLSHAVILLSKIFGVTTKNSKIK